MDEQEIEKEEEINYRLWEKKFAFPNTLKCFIDRTKYYLSMPVVKGEIDAGQIYNIIKSRSPGCQIYLADWKYKLTTIEAVKRKLLSDPTNQVRYEKTYYDCDDFSFRLMGNFNDRIWGKFAFGIAWSTGHAFNIFIDDKKQLWVIEPQNDNCIKYENAGTFYVPFALVIM